jgi:hypothetical protein
VARVIDITDAKFKIPANAAVMDYIRTANSFAHSDLGSTLIELGKGIARAHAYCPDYRACAYVVLHNDADVIFALAAGMKRLAFRLPDTAATEALADGAAPCEIGADWLAFDAFPKGRASALATWCAAAFRHAPLPG